MSADAALSGGPGQEHSLQPHFLQGSCPGTHPQEVWTAGQGFVQDFLPGGELDLGDSSERGTRALLHVQLKHTAE